MGKIMFLVAAVVAFSGSVALANHARDFPAERHPHYLACLHGGWNHPACDYLHHYGDSSDYYQHHDRRHDHGLADGG